MSQPVRIVKVAPPAGPGVIDHPRPDRLVRGNPRRETWLVHESGDVGATGAAAGGAGGTSVGIWACEPGMWRIAFAPHKEEYFFVVEGLVRLHDEAGVVVDVRAGEAAVIPGGFVGAFEVVEAVRKHFVVIERPGPST